ncbi:ABC-F family ATP-binding cassette domain-containing protein [Salinisphaera sp. Q1T1-3]|uniref:ABC-F family ATP-binding cassette domain-containing protein n=1 Tax=Salinisphaera sp. Q1T1-3 TaxID=2321229 RepID=UPI000E71EC0E|nr:ATP-binding cassette domain-containing protein [Salinisphaera sp. Q1T1-3]RJS91352.1 ATP-binding cassette domain-containing protein [Salinisphaera sp. Q1T1-3]
MIAFKHLSLRRGPRKLLEDVDLRIQAGQRVGIVGANGTGKSSLLAMMLGELSPDAGDIEIPAHLDIATVRQHAPSGDQPAIEYVLDGDAELRAIETQLATAEAEGDGNVMAELHGRLAEIDGYAARARAARLLHGLGFAPSAHEAPIDDFSGGWRVRLNLAAALMHRADLLLLDEPTNHLDMDAVFWLQDYLAAHPATLVIISHDRDFLDALATHTLHLEHGRATLYTGNYSAFELMRAEAKVQQQAAYENQQKQLAQLQHFVDRFRAKATKARQAQSKLKQMERMEKVEAAHWDTPFSFQFLAPDRLPETILRVNDADVGYDDTPLVGDVKLRLVPGDRLAILGRNGAGKSTVMKLLAGALEPLDGEVHRDKYLKVGYFAQHQLEVLDDTASAATHLQRQDPKASEQHIRDFLGGFDFTGDKALEPIAPFSGGEKARLALALVVHARPNLLLLDEPTNHLDLDMRHALETALAGYTGAVVMIAHDRHLIDATCDQLWRVADGALEPFDGDLDDYAKWLSRQNNAREGSKAKGADKPDASRKKSGSGRHAADQRAREKPLRNALKKAEEEMNRLSRKIEALDAELGKASVYSNPAEAARVTSERDTLARQLEDAEARWMDAAEQLDNLSAQASPA